MRSTFLISIVLAAALVSAASLSVANEQCNLKPLGKLNSLRMWSYGTGVAFSTPTLQVDADGAPDSYRVAMGQN